MRIIQQTNTNSKKNKSQINTKIKSVMETYYIQGIIEKIYEPQVVTEKFTKQEFIIHQPGQHEQHIKLVCVNTRLGQLAKVQEGQLVECAFNIRGKKWSNPEGKEGINQTLQAFEVNPVNHAPQQG